MKHENKRRGTSDASVYQRLKPFTIVGAAIALGIIGFDPDDQARNPPVEQVVEDLQPPEGEVRSGQANSVGQLSTGHPDSHNTKSWDLPTAEHWNGLP
jgi:hypothetical protein